MHMDIYFFKLVKINVWGGCPAGYKKCYRTLMKRLGITGVKQQLLSSCCVIIIQINLYNYGINFFYIAKMPGDLTDPLT